MPSPPTPRRPQVTRPLRHSGRHPQRLRPHRIAPLNPMGGPKPSPPPTTSETPPATTPPTATTPQTKASDDKPEAPGQQKQTEGKASASGTTTLCDDPSSTPPVEPEGTSGSQAGKASAPTEAKGSGSSTTLAPTLGGTSAEPKAPSVAPSTASASRDAGCAGSSGPPKQTVERASRPPTCPPPFPPATETSHPMPTRPAPTPGQEEPQPPPPDATRNPGVPCCRWDLLYREGKDSLDRNRVPSLAETMATLLANPHFAHTHGAARPLAVVDMANAYCPAPPRQ